MECNYEPYIQITRTTNFPPIRCRSFTKACELESLFQQEKCHDKLSRDRGRRRYCKEKDTGQNTTGGLGKGGGGGGYDHYQSTMTPNEYATRAFHERYSGLAPKAFCLRGPDGSKALCLDRKEFEAIVERSRNKDSDCVVLCPDSRDNEYLDDEVRRSPPSLTECRCPRLTRDGPGEPPIHRPPDPSIGRGGMRGSRVRAGATTKAAVSVRWNTDPKIGFRCLKGSCGRSLKCPNSQTDNNKIPRSTSKPRKRRLPPLENNSCHGSKINQPSTCECRCCSCHQMIPNSDQSITTSSSNRFKDSCKAPAANSERFRPKRCCTENPSSGSQTNRGNFLPPICSSDSRRTRQQTPFHLDACDDDDDVRPMCGSNVYVIRSDDYPKTNSNGICNARCTVGEKMFKLSAM